MYIYIYRERERYFERGPDRADLKRRGGAGGRSLGEVALDLQEPVVVIYDLLVYNVCVYIYIYILLYITIIYIYIYVYIERDIYRERETYIYMYIYTCII